MLSDFVVTCKGCRENIAASIQTLPDDWIIEACPFCGERRRYLPKRFSEDAFHTNTWRSGRVVGLEVGGYNDRPDWPKLGPSLLIASALVLAIRTAKWPASHEERLSNHDLNKEIDFAISLADSELSRLMSRERAFPSETGALVSGQRR